ncbi:uncharacterized protein UTRI_04188 [Ustilago trichophora]|uniref:Tc1-like transposase DDE domain-containing protein n=1 Tax=Ustilago trichophora TaxID=86804 RepID=A0A5C3EAV8_9BASI|nr:uncharacterized protein UTRI_04188_B [Ustilago trichophora]SPO32444.1 uncharacterized protein UTRI_04188 [Ustilago trichophora]
MVTFVGEHQSATLNEIRDHLISTGGPAISATHLSRLLADRCHLTLKRLHIEHERYNSAKTIQARPAWVRQFQVEMGSFDNAIFFDEAGFNLHSSRSVGCAPTGQRAQQTGRPADCKPNISLLVAIGKDGLYATDMVTGGWNSVSFVAFLNDRLFPDIAGQHRTPVMDNARFHHTGEVQEAVEQAGHRLCFLPPYSPWFNISEWVFSKIKPVVSCKELCDHNGLTNVIDSMLSTITANDCAGWLRETARWMIVAEHGHPLGPEHNASAALARHGLSDGLQVYFNSIFA